MPQSRDATSHCIARDCIAVRVRLLNRVVSKVYDDALRPLGIKTSQLNILVATAQLGLARPAEIGLSLKMDISTVSRNVDRMRTKGWIEVVDDEFDGRAHQFLLSEAGRQLLEKALPAWEKAQERAGKLLGPPALAGLVEAAERIRAQV